MMDAKEEEVKISLGSLTDEELLGIIRKVSKIHAGESPAAAAGRLFCFMIMRE